MAITKGRRGRWFRVPDPHCLCTLLDAKAFLSVAPRTMRKFAPAALRFGRTFSKLATKVEGAPDTTDFSIYMTQDGMTVSPWHSVPYQQPNGLYTYINEIPKATTAKMEVSTKVELNPIKQDMKKGKLRYFTYDMGTNGIPFNYGLMPQTFEDPDESHPDTGVCRAVLWRLDHGGGGVLKYWIPPPFVLAAPLSKLQ